MKKTAKFEGESKCKAKGKKKMATVKKDGEKPTCTQCQKGHGVSKCWKLHPELRPKKFRGNKDKGKSKATATVIQDLSPTQVMKERLQLSESKVRVKVSHFPLIQSQVLVQIQIYLLLLGIMINLEVHCFMYES